MIETVAFVGLGAMGLPMAKNALKKGFAAVGFDLSADRPGALVEAGGRAAVSAAAAAREADAAFVMLPDAPEVEAALFGKDGIAAGAKPGFLVVNGSTMAPARGRALAERAAAAGLRLLEAPVTGGTKGAIAASLVFMVGGAADDLAEARPLLAALGGAVHHIGGHGSGLAMKLVNNALSIATTALVAEATEAGRRFGLDRKMILDVVTSGTGDSYSLRERLPRMIAENYALGFAIDLAHKDLTLALEMAASAGAAMPTVAAAREAYSRARARGLGALDTSAIGRHYAGEGK